MWCSVFDVRCSAGAEVRSRPSGGVGVGVGVGCGCSRFLSPRMTNTAIVKHGLSAQRPTTYYVWRFEDSADGGCACLRALVTTIIEHKSAGEEEQMALDGRAHPGDAWSH